MAPESERAKAEEFVREHFGKHVLRKTLSVKQAATMFMEWRERRVQELEEALRRTATETHLCCCGGETHKNCPKNKAHNFLVCKLCEGESLGLNDAIAHKAECLLANSEWREQIRKGAKHE